MTKRGRGSKRVRVSWESSVEQDGTWVRLYKPYDGKMWLTEKFKAGDRVRVIVELLARTRKG